MRFDTEKLVRASDGIWYCHDEDGLADDISYPSEAYNRCYDIEDGSFWFRHRNKCILAAVETFSPTGDGVIYDTGGGNGYVASGLARAGFGVVLVEPGRQGALNARKRGLEHVICATTNSAGFSRGELSNIGLFDVLEHIANDHAFLVSLADLLRPSGMLYLSVPAYDGLWSQADVAAGHYRRYTLDRIVAVVRSAGFDVVYATYFFQPLLVPIFLFRCLPFRVHSLLRDTARSVCQTTTARAHVARSPRITNLIERVLISEARSIRKGYCLRMGTSCLVVAKKKKNDDDTRTSSTAC